MSDLTLSQQKTYDFLCRVEARESLTSPGNFDCYCHSCGDKVYCHAADTVKEWLWQHAGHHTWVKYFGKERISCPGR